MTDQTGTFETGTGTGVETGTQQKPEPTTPTSTEEGLVEVSFLPADRKVQLGPEIPFDEGLILQSREGTFVLSFPFDRAERAGDGHEALEHLRDQVAARWRNQLKGEAPCHLRLVIACPEHGVRSAWEINLGFASKTS